METALYHRNICVFVTIPTKSSYNFPRLHFNLQLFHMQQTVRTAA